MTEENKDLEKIEEKEVPFRDLKLWEKIVFCLFVAIKSLLNWKAIIGILLICIYFSSANEHSSLGAEDAYQGGRALYLFGGCILIGIGAGTSIKKILS